MLYMYSFSYIIVLYHCSDSNRCFLGILFVSIYSCMIYTIFYIRISLTKDLYFGSLRNTKETRRKHEISRKKSFVRMIILWMHPLGAFSFTKNYFVSFLLVVLLWYTHFGLLFFSISCLFYFLLFDGWWFPETLLGNFSSFPDAESWYAKKLFIFRHFEFSEFV